MASSDILGRIADARAQMMMRGHLPERLTLEIGNAIAVELELRHEIGAILVMGMAFTVHDNFEGFAVRSTGP